MSDRSHRTLRAALHTTMARSRRARRSRRWEVGTVAAVVAVALAVAWYAVNHSGPSRGGGVGEEESITQPGVRNGSRGVVPADAEPKGHGERVTPPLVSAGGHHKMLALLEGIADRVSDDDPFLGDRRVRTLRNKVARLDASSRDSVKGESYYHLGLAELALGREREAIDYLTKCYNIILTKKVVRSRADVNLVVFQLGVAYMRLGETQNCCLRNNPDSCILPIQGEGVHSDQLGSRRAIEYFNVVLQNPSQDSVLQLEARWLLNIAYMTIGTYPNAVPSEYVIPPEAFHSDETFPRFVNIASRLGLDTFSQCGGAIADDFDNDGYLDLIVSQFDPRGQIRFFRNSQDGTFSDRTGQAGLLGFGGGLNLVQADYNNDGNLDFLVLRGAWRDRAGRHPNSLMRNNGDGTFTDVTLEAGLGEVHYPTQTAAWGDYDNDGDLDLYIGNESTTGLNAGDLLKYGYETTAGLDAPCQLFRNNGDGSFTDVAAKAGVTNDRFTKAVVWGDYDDDRLPDIYVSNFGQPNRLYHNNGNGTFTDLAVEAGVAEPIASFPVWFWDFNNDGNLDLYVSAYLSGIAHATAAGLGMTFDDDPALARLYRGNGHGGFEDVTRQANLTRPTLPMGANFGDLDNDGYLDFYLGTGDGLYKSLLPSKMYRNRAGQSFADITTAGGFGHLQKGHAVAFADLDNDGDQDVFAQMGGSAPGDKFADALYENPGLQNHWINVHLVGVRSNRSAIGARICVEVTEGGRRRSIYKHVNSGGSFGANPLRQTIGLGQATDIERLDVFWPTTGRLQSFHDVPLDQFLQITEDQNKNTPRIVRRKKLTFPTGTIAESRL